MAQQTANGAIAGGISRVAWLVTGVPALLGVTALAVAGFWSVPAVDGLDAAAAALVQGEGRAARLAIVAVGLGAVGASILAWFSLQVSVVRPLESVAAYLREARRGRAVDPPRHSGVVGDIAVLASDLVETQVQVGRYVVSLQNIDTVATTIGDAARQARAEADRMSGTVASFAAEIDGARQRIQDSCGTATEAILGSAARINEARDAIAVDAAAVRDAPQRIEAAAAKMDHHITAAFGAGGHIAHLTRDISEIRATQTRERDTAHDLAGQMAAIASLLQSQPKGATADSQDKLVAELRTLASAVSETRSVVDQVRAHVLAPSPELEATLGGVSAWREESALRLAALQDGLMRAAGAYARQGEKIDKVLDHVVQSMDALGTTIPAALSSQAATLTQEIRQAGSGGGLQATTVLGGIETGRAHLVGEIAEVRKQLEAVAHRPLEAPEPLAPLVEGLAAHISKTSESLGDTLARRLDHMHDVQMSAFGALPKTDTVLGTVAGVARAIDEVRGLVEAHADTSRSDLFALTQRLDAAEAALRAEVSAAGARLASDIAAMPGPETVAATLDPMMRALDHLLDGKDTVLGSVDRVGRALDDVRGLLEAHADTSRSDLHALTQRLDAAEAGLRTDLSAAGARLASDIAAMPKPEPVAATLAPIMRALDHLPAEVAARQDHAIADLGAHIKSVGDGVERCLTATTQARSGLASDLQAALDLLVERLDAIRSHDDSVKARLDDVTTSLASLEDAERRANADRGVEHAAMRDTLADIRSEVSWSVSEIVARIAASQPVPEATSPFATEGPQHATLDDVCARLDAVADQIDGLAERLVPAEGETPPTASDASLDTADGGWPDVEGRLADIAVRLDLMLDAVTAQAGDAAGTVDRLRPEFDRIAQSIAHQSDAIGRIREQVGFATGTLAGLPTGFSRELGGVTTAVASGIAALTSRMDDAAAKLDHLTDAVESRSADAAPVLPVPSAGPSPATAQAMAALHDRFDDVIARLDLLADTVEGERGLPAMPGSAVDVAHLIEDRQLDLVQRIEALRTGLERGGSADWHASVVRIEATLASVRQQVAELVHAANPMTAQLEYAIDTLRASLSESSETPVILSALDEIRRLLEDLHAAQAGARDNDLPVLTPPSARAITPGLGALPGDWREPLDRLSARIEALSATVESALLRPQPPATSPVMAVAPDDAVDAARFALADVVLSVEQSLEQPVQEWRSAVTDLRALVETMAAAAPRSPGAPESPAHEVPSVAGAIRIMDAFIATIDDRFSEIEALLAGASSAGAPLNSALQASMDDAVDALRGLIRQFVDVGCAISGELEANERTRRIDRVA